MAFRFRRSMKIAPGVRLNLSNKSFGVRVGPKGVGYSVNSSGRRTVSAGLPGTGLHVSETTKAGSPGNSGATLGTIIVAAFVLVAVVLGLYVIAS